jgi:superfamily II DNA or RNA helicase
MKLPFTQKEMQDWGGANAYRDGLSMAQRGCVTESEWNPETRVMHGVVSWGSHSIRTGGRVLPDGALENRCPCRDSVDRGVVCSHVLALASALLAKFSDPDRERKLLEEERRARHMQLMEEKAFVRRVPRDTPGAQNCRLNLVLPQDWERAARAPEGLTPVEVHIVFDGGMTRRLDGIPRDLLLGMSGQDDSILFVLEEIAGGRVPGRMHLGAADFINVLALHKGKGIRDTSGREHAVNTEGAETVMHVDLDHGNGELLLNVKTELPGEPGAESPIYWVAGKRGFVFGGDAFWPLREVLPEPFHAIYRDTVKVGRPAVPRFLKDDLPPLRHWLKVETEIEPDVFDIEPEMPRFRLLAKGSAASLSMTLQAVYGDVVLPCAAPCVAGSFAHPDPEDILRYTVRSLAAETAALMALSVHGIVGRNGTELSPVVGLRNVLNFLGGTFRALRRRGWSVEFAGRIARDVGRMNYAFPVVRIDGEPGKGFDVTVFHEDAKGRILPAPEIHRALLKGDSFIEWNGRTILLDAGAIRSLSSVFSDCATGEGHKAGSFRLEPVHAAYVAGALESLDGVEIDAPPEWLKRAAEQNRLAPADTAPLDPRVDAILRPYQKAGVRWLRFLEQNRFAGILADEMGLGKTIQTLVWLADMLARQTAEKAPKRPALIVCPTSLVENWIAESRQFTPWLKTEAITGAERHAKWKDLAQYDIVVTSYALLRRDIEQYAMLEFSAAVLDEAQNIKNFSSQNARAAKRLQAPHRLVLTGTPIENGVFDLWSIMDFLMPSYLGSADAFKANFAQPIAQGGPEGEMAQWKLRRKLRPFLLRRLKRDVAKELPPKIERLAKCALTPEQAAVYKALLDDSRKRIGDMVKTKGFNQSRFEILRTLMRLRQACCHLSLLPYNDPVPEFKEPSGKMDLFFELLDEARDGGHRVLVFSQFTSMLAIIRAEMDARGIRYCYLDGATKNRLEIVRQFNGSPDIPVFLISLKAGGTGLNLTGADMVIHYDPWWNPAVEDQATDRAYRIGQKRTVYSVKLITRGTIEERVLALQRRKQQLYAATIGTTSTGPEMTRDLTWNDVRELLDL